MKTYKTTIYPSRHQLYLELVKLADQKFKEHIKTKEHLYITEKEDGIEIGIPEIYETYLYKIDVKGSNVSINKSEHYTDDINSLTLENVINDIVLNYIGEANIDGILPSGPISIH